MSLQYFRVKCIACRHVKYLFFTQSALSNPKNDLNIIKEHMEYKNTLKNINKNEETDVAI